MVTIPTFNIDGINPNEDAQKAASTIMDRLSPKGMVSEEEISVDEETQRAIDLYNDSLSNSINKIDIHNGKAKVSGLRLRAHSAYFDSEAHSKYMLNKYQEYKDEYDRILKTEGKVDGDLYNALLSFSMCYWAK